MAVLLSTTDGKALTGTQHRALNQALGITDDYVIDNYGGKLASTYTGWQITTQTGMAVLNGTLIEVTSNAVNTFDAAGVSGTAMVIAKVDLNTKIATIELKKGITLVQNNLLSSLTGTREYELYRFTHSAVAITGFTDKRLIRSNGVDARVSNILTNLIPNESYLALVDVSQFVITTATVMNASVPQILPLSKISGGLAIASNLITLPKGYLYEAEFSFRANGTGFALIRSQTSGGVTVFPADAFVVTSTSTYGESNLVGGGVFDLTASGVDSNVRLANLDQTGGITLYANENSRIIIKKYKKITV